MTEEQHLFLPGARQELDHFQLWGASSKLPEAGECTVPVVQTRMLCFKFNRRKYYCTKKGAQLYIKCLMCDHVNPFKIMRQQSIYNKSDALNNVSSGLPLSYQAKMVKTYRSSCLYSMVSRKAHLGPEGKEPHAHGRVPELG